MDLRPLAMFLSGDLPCYFLPWSLFDEKKHRPANFAARREDATGLTQVWKVGIYKDIISKDGLL